ncbi:MAG: response regulator [Sideroxydans sp.]|nr:response regulator [Sideroxydans sp.]
MKKILLVDDHADIRRLIKITIGNGFEVLEAEDGTTGFNIVRQHKPDLVVLDVMMPGEMDGLKVLDMIKSDPELEQIKVIMVTARGQVADYDDGMKRGADAYFIKPFSPLQLVSFIQEKLAE